MTVPKLRFKEFDEAWKPVILADISNIVTGSTPATSKSEYYDGDFLFVSPADIQENRYVEATKTTLTEEGFNKCRHIPKNSILFVCIGSTIGKIAQNKEICATNQQINAVIPNDDYISDFLYLVLDKLAPSIKLTAGVQAVPLINKTEFGKTEFFTPTLGEQTKIASFLSAVDEKISQLTQKNRLLCDYKQGMMQKLFSQQLRFKANDGREFGEWEETILGEVVKFSNGKRIPLSETERQNRKGNYRYYGASGVIDYLDDYIFDGQYILIGEDGANILTRSSRLAFVVEGQFWVNNHAHIFQSKIGSNLFLASYLESLNYEKFNSGTAQPKLNLENLKKVPVINPSLAEQTKIANFLSAIDQKIEVVAEQIEQAKTWKKGLLQQMFL